MVNDKYKNGFLRQVESSMRGDITFIPNALDRVNGAFNLLQSRYHLIQASSGTGKTAITDFMFVLNPYMYLKDIEDVHWEVIYFSLERKETFKHAKWLSWFMKQKDNLYISADDLMGFGKETVNEQGYKYIRSFDSTMNDLLSHIHLYDGKVTPSTVEEVVQRRADELGVLFWADSEAVYTSTQTVYLERFDDKNLIEDNKAGNRHYILITHKGEQYKIYQNDYRYFLDNPKTFVFIVIDGINLLGNKEAMDKISEAVANARDRYGFSPVIVNQQNRSMADVQRLKLHKGDLSPQLGDGFKSSQMGFDADIVLGLFDPVEFKALNNHGKYLGYNIKGSVSEPGMLHPKGFSRFRSLHILKNSFGIAGGAFGLRFTGESNHFETLPYPDDPEMLRIYQEISQGK